MPILAGFHKKGTDPLGSSLRSPPAATRRLSRRSLGEGGPVRPYHDLGSKLRLGRPAKNDGPAQAYDLFGGARHVEASADGSYDSAGQLNHCARRDSAKRRLQAEENELISVAESRKAKTAALSKAMERFRETLRIAGAVCLPSTSVSLFFSCLLFSSCAQMGDASRRKKALKHGGAAQLSSRSCLERFAPVDRKSVV